MINSHEITLATDRPKELTIQLLGGLGNQLFQFAFGLYLNDVCGHNVRYSDLLLRSLPGSSHTNRTLGIGDLLKKHEISELTPSRYSLIAALNKGLGGFIATEEPLDSTSPIILGNRTKLVRGYFQQFGFADAVKSQILNRLFQSSDFSIHERSPVVKRICIHMRYGDYSSNEQTRKFHGLTSTQFFVDQARKLSDEFGVRDVFIVSDEPHRALQEFLQLTNKNEFDVAVSASATEHSDLIEIATSGLVITSNSSFSWWGAWLANSIYNSIVVCPDPWYADAKMSNPYLIKPNWRIAQRSYS